MVGDMVNNVSKILKEGNQNPPIKTEGKKRELQFVLSRMCTRN